MIDMTRHRRNISVTDRIVWMLDWLVNRRGARSRSRMIETLIEEAYKRERDTWTRNG
jgi:metal-responsive CopG/Arc/MetJ family transcriptional regulator